MDYIWKHRIGNVLLTWGGKLQRVYDYSKGTFKIMDFGVIDGFFSLTIGKLHIQFLIP
jgi:hypothetical protein